MSSKPFLRQRWRVASFFKSTFNSLGQLALLFLLGTLQGLSAAEVQLAWDTVADSRVAVYEVHYGSQSGSYGNRLDSTTTSASVPNLQAGSSYFFAVKACDSARAACSAYSNEVSTTIPAEVTPPVASFTVNGSTASSLTVALGDPVNLADTSTGTVSSRTWNLGDGTSASTPTVVKTYTTAGTRTVVLSVTGAGVTRTASKTITVAAPEPVPSFTANGSTASSLTVAPGQSVTLVDTSTGTVTSRAWSLGDGTTATAPTVVKSYATVGTRTVNLSVTGAGVTRTVSKSINVVAAPPVADFSANVRAGDAPLAVQFQSLSSGLIDTWQWDFGDGTTGTGATATRSYAKPGLYAVTLTVSGPGGSNTLKKVDYIDVKAAPIPLEVGEVVVDHTWKRVNFNRTFVNPIVIAAPLGSNDGEPAVARVTGIDQKGFSIRVQEWDYLDGVHGEETVSYVVMERGRYQLPNGAQIEAGSVNTSATNAFISKAFTKTFATIPVVLAAVNSTAEGDAVTARVRYASRTSFQVGMREQEANKQSHKTERIDYIAWEPSAGEVNGMPYEVGRTASVVTDRRYTLTYEPFESPPLFLAKMQTTNNGDTAELRWDNRYEETLEVWVAEEQSKDAEVSHVAESVGYLLIDAEGAGGAEPPAAPPSVCSTPCSLWDSAVVPSMPAKADYSAVELGVKIRSDVDGFITGVRFYKGTGNTGTHVGRLWSSTGQLLAQATFTNETASGWQQVDFATPVAVKANTVYVVSYYAPAGGYAYNEGYFTSAYTKGPLRALSSTEGGGNGVYRYGTGGVFPTSTYQSANYWVDAVFSTK